MPNPPPATSSPHPPLKKFTLIPPSLTAPASPLTLCLTHPGSLPTPALAALRASLLASRSLAVERLSLRDANKRNLAERQASDKRASEEGSRVKEVERRKKRDEDDRRERERVDRNEKERVERERSEMEEKRKEAEVYERVRIKNEEDKRVADERARELAVKQAREMKEAKERKEKKRVEDVLVLVRANEQEHKELEVVKEMGNSSGAEQEDIVMGDTPALTAATADSLPSQPSQPLPPPPSAAPTFSQQPSPIVPAPPFLKQIVPSITIDSSPEPEDDGQPRPPMRHKSSMDKKRKRDQILDSDASDSENEGQPLLQKVRKQEDASRVPSAAATPTPTPATVVDEPPPTPRDPYEGLSNIQRKLKDEKFIKHSIPTKAIAPGTATAFYLPSHSLVPIKPELAVPTPTPKKQSEVAEDFSKAKPGTQIAHHTFHTWAEAYLRPFGEDDLAFLAPKPDDITPYLIPSLGKHYLERWEDEDADMPLASTSYVSPLEPPPLARVRPDALTEDALGMENVYLGPLSERLMAALAFEEEGESGDLEEKERPVAVVETEDDPYRPLQLDAVDLEERIRKELRFIGLIGEEEVDWSAREDDEVSSALRACQLLLQRETITNDARKSVLGSIVKDRMAFQDYETTRDAQERAIENGWTKRQRAGKKKGKGKERDKPIEGPKPPVSLALLSAVEKRHQLVSQFMPFFEDDEDKGRFFGIPEESVYEGLEVAEEGESALLE